jgi:hypothetical protein
VVAMFPDQLRRGILMRRRLWAATNSRGSSGRKVIWAFDAAIPFWDIATYIHQSAKSPT